ncbi:TetR/AcrR family transcriptional regulator [Allostreptomyces psammosilenae]|uniref:AcrR family transcriptional regulator n=1 Tax=Allostreptomyces psammosilenae TaxID=1892865 RepID=A0A852ZZW1_9ACTN|nr:TetR/AcrR family transcriptional regulator [Allostreptomyces psammosilenae]NYI07913.1 AcrR family transcriptional regulator [Allostreptomyces psammosilenae]
MAERLRQTEPAGPAGLRERKKQRTRRALFEAAMRLFAEKGYEQTTVAEIAAAADVSTKTLFNYFPGKEDLVFAYNRVRLDLLLEVVANPEADEAPVDLLARMMRTLLTAVADEETGADLALSRLRLHLLKTVPELQARALMLTLDIQRQLATELCKSYPDRVDPTSAAAAVGTLIGAAQASGLAALEQGASTGEMKAAAWRGVEVALAGVRHADLGVAPATPSD